VRLLESYARAWITDGGDSDPAVDQVARLLRRDATVTVSALARATGLSERQLHRRCTTAFGYGPATLRRILRLQRFIQLGNHPAAPRSLAVLAAIAGYADQQHLARDSRTIARTTPSALVPAGVAAPPQ
jgi:transcriptional regulator GlxA family with amidase domain